MDRSDPTAVVAVVSEKLAATQTTSLREEKVIHGSTIRGNMRVTEAQKAKGEGKGSGNRQAEWHAPETLRLQTLGSPILAFPPPTPRPLQCHGALKLVVYAVL